MLCVLQIIHILINAYFPLLKKITVVILVSVGVKYYPIFSSVQSLSHVQLFAIPWNSLWNSPGQNIGVGSHSLP